MDEKTDQVISLRISEELYGKLKKYADEHSESISDTAREAIERFFGAAPVPQPPQVPGVPSDLPRKVEELSIRLEDTRQFINDMGMRFNQTQEVVNRIWALLSPYFPPPLTPLPPMPPLPFPPWVMSSADAGEQGEKAEK